MPSLHQQLHRQVLRVPEAQPGLHHVLLLHGTRLLLVDDLLDHRQHPLALLPLHLLLSLPLIALVLLLLLALPLLLPALLLDPGSLRGLVKLVLNRNHFLGLHDVDPSSQPLPTVVFVLLPGITQLLHGRLEESSTTSSESSNTVLLFAWIVSLNFFAVCALVFTWSLFFAASCFWRLVHIPITIKMSLDIDIVVFPLHSEDMFLVINVNSGETAHIVLIVLFPRPFLLSLVQFVLLLFLLDLVLSIQEPAGTSWKRNRNQEGFGEGKKPRGSGSGCPFSPPVPVCRRQPEAV